MDRLQQDYLGTTKQPRECYRKGIEVLEESRLGSIEKGLPKDKLPKGDLGRATTILLKVVSFSRDATLSLPSSDRPY